ncbi:glycoside hydrolase family 28 protein [Laccaria bicolor S238N-H82]|uniref:Glycoside hydrolase family 28 protein n=1 Tax=Laccaria bicolor (strain S238N-H82 / ATCC MYA-4686) TaxID=486041 RepID=B0DIX1_LACBS|nr:glycoside hydrolase family 28 protein [Laccaria bicolor S238N-H82]EDR05417.1 glycoside hydrolase family 28 protein [Laccaria bicolor S238N-H82]|eukprot:XP_001883975.1 glycoside hydrolase family 28 protein [Laccaria bicolor S238N-H82]
MCRILSFHTPHNTQSSGSMPSRVIWWQVSCCIKKVPFALTSVISVTLRSTHSILKRARFVGALICVRSCHTPNDPKAGPNKNRLTVMAKRYFPDQPVICVILPISQLWDAQNQINRPHGIAFSHTNNGVIRDMKIWKPIAWNSPTSGTSNIHVLNNKIIAVSSTQSFPFNTDGFSAGGANMILEDNLIQNGDDGLTVGSGASNITFRSTYCEGGHGLSIGSLGKAGLVANVQNVLIENIQMVGLHRCLILIEMKYDLCFSQEKQIIWRSIQELGRRQCSRMKHYMEKRRLRQRFIPHKST